MQTLVGTLNMPKVVSDTRSDEDQYERDLVRRIRANDRAAAEELVDRTYGAVYASLMRLCANADLAADLTQETYRKAWQSFPSFRGESRVFTWLYRIAYTSFLNLQRRPAIVRNVSDDELPEPADPERLPDDKVIEELDQSQLRNAVLQLGEKQRFVITAHYWGELTLPEIAKIERVSAVAIRKRLANAHRALEKLLEESQ